MTTILRGIYLVLFVSYAWQGNLSVLAAQENKNAVHLEVAVVGDDLQVKPVPFGQFIVLNEGEEIEKVTTDMSGRSIFSLMPGTYTIKSATEIRYQGTAFTWAIPFDVAANEDNRILLTNGNASHVTYDPAPSGRRQSEASGIFQRIQSGVFTIYGIQGRGSGFLVSDKGLVLTNAHVMTGTTADEARVQISADIKVAAHILALDEKRDIAVLLINMAHCQACTVLELADPSEGPLVDVGEEILAVGSPLNQTQILTTGVVSKLEASAVLSDVNINQGNSGGPMLRLDSKVVGINTFHDPGEGGPGISGAILITEANEVLREANEYLAGMAVNPVSPVLHPTEPQHAFPIEILERAAATEEYDLDDYEIDAGPFKVMVMTPPVMAWRQAQAMRELTARRQEREEEANIGVDEKIDPIQGWYAWDQYVGERRAVVIFNVIPEVGQTKGSIFRGILSGLASGMTGVYYHSRSTVEFKGDFRRLKLLRDGLVIPPVLLNRSPAILNVETYLTEGKDFAYQGIYVYKPDVFRPNSDGSFSDYTLVITDLKNPEEDQVVRLDEDVLEAIWNDFSEFLENN